MFSRHRFRLNHSWLAVPLAIAVIAAMACSSDDGDSSSSPAAPTAAVSTPASASSGSAATNSGAAGASTLAVSVGEGTLGNYLTGPDGKTLYVFLKDAPNKSNCTGGCLQSWPPLLLKDGQTVKADSAAEGDFASIDTPSGKQVTYNGAPLYYFASDAQSGDTKGNLVGNVWFLARPESASTAVVGARSDEGKNFLVGPTGMTLYTFARDTAGASNCGGQCLANWPALTVPEGLEPTAVTSASGALAVITRDDGARQVTYNGAPIYYYAGDKLPGDTNGDGVGGVWALAKP